MSDGLLTEAQLVEGYNALMNQSWEPQPPIVTRRVKAALYWVRLNMFVKLVMEGEDYPTAFARADRHAYHLAGGRG